MKIDKKREEGRLKRQKVHEESKGVPQCKTCKPKLCATSTGGEIEKVDMTKALPEPVKEIITTETKRVVESLVEGKPKPELRKSISRGEQMVMIATQSQVRVSNTETCIPKTHPNSSRYQSHKSIQSTKKR